MRHMPNSLPLSAASIRNAGRGSLLLIADLLAGGGSGIGFTFLVGVVAIGRQLIQPGS